MILLSLFLTLSSAHAALEIVSCEAYSYVDSDDSDNLCVMVRGKVRNTGTNVIPKNTTLEVMVNFEGNCDLASGGGSPNALEKPLSLGEMAAVQGGGCFNRRTEREKMGQIASICTEPGGGPKCFNLQGKNCTFNRSKILNPKNFRECKIRKGKPKG